MRKIRSAKAGPIERRRGEMGMKSIARSVLAVAGLAVAVTAAEAQTLQHDEVARCAALRRPAHDLVAHLRHRQHDPGHAGGAGLGRQDGDPVPRQVLEGQRATARPTPSSCATTCSSAAARSSPPPTWSTPSSACSDPEPKAPLAWRAGNIKELRAPDPYTVEYELERALLRPAAATSPCSPRRSTTRRASRSSARTTASRRSTAPARGASSRGSRAPRSC